MDHRWYASKSAVRGYKALRHGAAWHDSTSRGRIRATGEDRLRLIHAISSNDVEGLAPGWGTYAFFLDARGRIQADSYIFVAEDHVLIDSEPEVAGSLREHIDSYIIMDDVTLEDIAPETAVLAIAGPEAGAVVDGLGLGTPPEPFQLEVSGDVWVFGAPSPGVGGYWIMAPHSKGPTIGAMLRDQGVIEATHREWDAHRVTNWVPRFGVDFGPTNIPHETGQFNAVSFSKGCYTGQEIVERVRSRGRVRRQLVGVELDTADIPRDLTVHHRGRPVGELTSPTPGQETGERARGFAILRGAASVAGAIVQVGGQPATVRDVTRKALALAGSGRPLRSTALQ